MRLENFIEWRRKLAIPKLDEIKNILQNSEAMSIFSENFREILKTKRNSEDLSEFERIKNSQTTNDKLLWAMASRNKSELKSNLLQFISEVLNIKFKNNLFL